MLFPMLQPMLQPMLRNLLGRSSVLPLSAAVAAMFANGEQGAWYDPSNIASLFQDSAGTVPVTADGQPVGELLDQSGRGNKQLQTVTTARPLYKIDSSVSNIKFDGASSGLSTATFAAGTLKIGMDFFIAMRRDSPASMLLAAMSTGGGTWFGVMDTSGGGTSSNSGAPTYAVNGVDVPGGTATTRAQLNAAVPVGQWVIVEIRNLNLSSWTAFVTGEYSGFVLNAGVAGLVLCLSQTPEKRLAVRRYLGQKVGLSF